MNNKLEAILETYKEEMIGKLQELIRIESVTESGNCGGTEASGARKAMQYIIDLGRSKGFESINYNDQACELNFGEKKEDSVGIVGHVDVVPAGGRWTYPPFGGELHGGRIYGRGAVDDKGPTIAAFYAALAVKESGLPLRRNITQIIGTNEESGTFPCIRYYLDTAKRIPSCGIVPDSFFPICFSEKHFVNMRFTKKSTGDGSGERILKSIKGGDAINVVPSWAEAVFIDGDGNLAEKVTETGITTHASTPEQGENAIAKLIDKLAEQTFEPQDICQTIKDLSKIMGRDTAGTGLGIACEDETGTTTNNLGLLSYEEGLLVVESNARLPLSLGQEAMVSRIAESISDTGLDFDITYYMKGFYTDPEKEPAKTLMQVYREETGDMESRPYANGSGSYARIMENFIPFGIALQNEPQQFHVENESIPVERLFTAAKIYAEALYRLAVM